MKSTFFILGLIAILSSNALAGSSPGQDQVKDFGYMTMEKVIIHTLAASLDKNKRKSIADPGGLIVLLGNIDSQESRHILSDLLEIYIGAANYEALAYAVAKQGQKIKPLLINLLSKPHDCAILSRNHIKNDTTLKCSTVENRNRRVNSLMKLIDQNVVIDYVI